MHNLCLSTCGWEAILVLVAGLCMIGPYTCSSDRRLGMPIMWMVLCLILVVSTVRLDGRWHASSSSWSFVFILAVPEVFPHCPVCPFPPIPYTLGTCGNHEPDARLNPYSTSFGSISDPVLISTLVIRSFNWTFSCLAEFDIGTEIRAEIFLFIRLTR